MERKGGKKREGGEGRKEEETEGSGSEGRIEMVEDKERDHVQFFSCLQHNSWGLHSSKSVALEIPHIAVQKCSPADNQ